MKDFNCIIIANWKMQLAAGQAKELARSIRELYQEAKISSGKQVVLCPDFVDLEEVSEVLPGSQIALGAQDTFYEEKGAYTSQISIKKLKDIGCQYVILGHSERRALGETDKMVNAKARAVLRNDLVPIICVGETFEERQEGNKGFVIMRQVYEALQDLEPKIGQKIIIAYEPVWVIGSGQAISGAEAGQTAAMIRQSYVDALDGKYTTALSVIYGGSVDPANIREFTKRDNIDGALVGGSSLQAKNFIELIKNA